jgi:prophage tail gpP-like protein
MKKVFLYFHINSFTEEVFYVGIGNIMRPYRKTNRSVFWNNIVKKFGYKVVIVDEFETWEQAAEKEKYYISFYGRRDKNTGSLVNLTDGGEGTVGMATHPNKGKPMSEASKLKMIATKLAQNRKSTKEQRQKISDKLRGRVFSEETKKKNSQSLKGRKLSEETKKKISEAAKKQWQTGNTWYSLYY